MTKDSCVICRYGLPVTSYDLDGLKMNSLLFKICRDHEKQVAERIIELEKEAPKKYVVKTGEPKPFIPKQLTREVKPNYQDREPGEDG